MQPLVRLAVLHSNKLAAEVNNLLLKWGYLLSVQTAFVLFG